MVWNWGVYVSVSAIGLRRKIVEEKPQFPKIRLLGASKIYAFYFLISMVKPNEHVDRIEL